MEHGPLNRSICRDLLDYDSNCEKEKPSDDEATCDNNWLEKSIARVMAVFVAAIVLALLNALTLTVRGTPWGITLPLPYGEENS